MSSYEEAVFAPVLEKGAPNSRRSYGQQIVSRAKLNIAIRRVNRGMKALDKADPDWVSKIKIDNLDMSNGCYCIVGQACGGYHRVSFVTQFDPVLKKHREHTKISAERKLGFMSSDMISFGLLDAVWSAAIKKRLARGKRCQLRPVA